MSGPAAGIAVGLALVLLIPATGAAGPSIEERVGEVRRSRAAAEARVADLTAELGTLAARYGEAAAAADAAAAVLVSAYREEAAHTARLIEARATLAERANAVYRAGPGAFAEVLLGSSDLSEVLARREIFERVVLRDVDQAAAALEARGAAARVRQRLEDARARLLERQRELEAIREQMAERLGEAEAALAGSEVRLRSLRERRRELARAETRAREQTAQLDALLWGGMDQSDLLALLGSNGGRGCGIPPELRRTGDGFTGLASYYGERFAGQPTASGAIFVPELFTAAHKTLPLPSFLHVTYRGRCATVLVNDRGPYIDGRVLDLSAGAAQYLGLAGPGVDTVTAEILSPE